MQITLDSNFDKAAHSVLIVAIEGTPDEIKKQLQSVLTQMELFKRPGQGVAAAGDYTTQIITPVWNRMKY